MPGIEIQLPSQLNDLIRSDTSFEAAIGQARRNFGPILRANKLTFFPEYTDHGIGHIQNVISTAHGLIRDEARELLTSADGSVLVLSAILHDLALHLQKDGFISLVRGKSPHRSIPWFKARFEEPTWPELWDEYLGQASRNSGRKNTELFGDSEPVPSPDLGPSSDWTEKQFLLVGEFIRRHHGRLAHEIARHGFPGPPGNSPPKLDPRLGEVSDIAGLVARSHTLPLRPSVDYLAAVFQNTRDPRQVHAPFLMALLRVADYLQVESDRANAQLLQIRSLRSPFSFGEWKTHWSIQQVRHSHDDREAIVIDATPQDITTFVKAKRLLAGIQSELDHSWAVLGEVYGPVQELHGLGLTIRRVRSNLDDEAEYAKGIEFVPVPASFEAADADLLKLLINPLYGDRPEIGVRELIQNAVDAVREMHVFMQKHPQRIDGIEAKFPDQTADVLILLEKDGDDEYWIRITDKGKGMDADILQNYFLRVGASYRKSDAWNCTF